MERVDRRSFLEIAGTLAAGAALLASGVNSPKEAEASATPEDLPSYITYFEEAAVSFINASDARVTLGRRGDILLLMGQKLVFNGLNLDIDPVNHPDMTQVVAVANEGNSPVTLNYQTFDGVFARQDRERTARTDRDFLIEDVTRAGLVQVSRSRIPGNCVATGCAATRLVTLLAYDKAGTAVLEPLTDRVV